MKFPRRTRLLRNPFDATAYAGVFLLLLLFISLSSRLYTPGVKISLPTASDLPGTDKPTVTVAMDQTGGYYFQNQSIAAGALKSQLATFATNSPEPLTLVIQADKNARHADLLKLALLARDAGIADSLLATLPRTDVAPAQP
jgi:biopolymer transport protein ExbD